MRSPSVRHFYAAAPAIALSLLLVLAVLPETTSAPGVRSSSAKSVVIEDTIRHEAAPAKPFILALPDSAGASYSILRAPALSWLVQRSFLWNAPPEDSGRYEILFERELSAERDTLVLIIIVS